MITFNQDVLKGEANGSRTFLQQVVLKPHEQAANVFIRSAVKAVTASQEYMLLNHSNEGETTDFPHETKKYSFVANLPLVGNYTTTNKRVKSHRW
jgi:hypothetical protein